MSSTTAAESDFDLSPERITELATLADAAAADAKRDWYEISSTLRDKRAAADIDAIAVAFDYRLQHRVDGNSHPMFHAAHLKPLTELPTSVADLWANVVDVSPRRRRFARACTISSSSSASNPSTSTPSKPAVGT